MRLRVAREGEVPDSAVLRVSGGELVSQHHYVQDPDGDVNVAGPTRQFASVHYNLEEVVADLVNYAERGRMDLEATVHFGGMAYVTVTTPDFASMYVASMAIVDGQLHVLVRQAEHRLATDAMLALDSQDRTIGYFEGRRDAAQKAMYVTRAEKSQILNHN